MTFEEWKKELGEKCEAIPSAYRSLVDSIEKINQLTGDFDLDEASAFMIVKIGRMQKAIETML